MVQAKQESKTLKEQWEEDKLIRNGASVALFSLLSFAPLLALITLVLQFIGAENISTQFIDQLSSIIGQGNADALSNTLQSEVKGGWSIGIISVISLFSAVYAVARQLRETLNEVFEVDRDEPTENEIQRNFKATVMVLLVGTAVIVMLALTATVGSLTNLTQSISMGTQIFAQIASFIGVSLLIALIFGLVYKTIPDADPRWRDLITGTLIAGALFAVGATIVTWYINSSAGVQSSLNVFGSTIVFMIWTLYASVVLLFGAEFIQHNARRNGRRIQPDYS